MSPWDKIACSFWCYSSSGEQIGCAPREGGTGPSSGVRLSADGLHDTREGALRTGVISAWNDRDTTLGLCTPGTDPTNHEISWSKKQETRNKAHETSDLIADNSHVTRHSNIPMSSLDRPPPGEEKQQILVNSVSY